MKNVRNVELECYVRSIETSKLIVKPVKILSDSRVKIYHYKIKLKILGKTS